MNELRKGLPKLPHHMRALPINEKGYPIPFFVAQINGKPDLRIADPAKINECAINNRCWICGNPLGKYFTFVSGPMCIINRVNIEPPAHKACAEFAARACPFLLLPKAQRRNANMPKVIDDPVFVEENLGVTVLWTTNSYRTAKNHGGLLFIYGDPEEITWVTEGRLAHNSEIDRGFVGAEIRLRRLAEEEGVVDTTILEQHLIKARKLIPSFNPYGNWPATYCGAIKELQDKTAIIRYYEGRGLLFLAQFDDSELEFNGIKLAHGWHQFLKTSFKI